MLEDLEQIKTNERLSNEDIQRFIYRTVDDLNYRLQQSAKTSEEQQVNYDEIIARIPRGPQGEPGEPGEDGETFYTWIKYSPYQDGHDMTDEPEDDTEYIGISYNNLSPIESDDPTDYAWSKFKGDKGEDGQDGDDGRGIISLQSQFYLSESDTQLIGGGWSTDQPEWESGKYLWIRQYITYDDGTSSYSTPIVDTQANQPMEALETTNSNLNDTNIKLNTITLDVNGIQVQVEGDATTISRLETEVGSNTTDIDSLVRELSDSNSRISGLTTNVNGINVSLENYAALVEELRDIASKSSQDIASTSEQLDELQDRFSNYQASVGQYVKIDETGLTVGAVGSDFKTVITDERLAFMDGNTTPAYISGQLFNMVNAIVRGTLKIGGYEFQPKANGRVYLVWSGID